MPIKSGIPAPAIYLPDESGTIRTLSDHLGHPVVLYFYPKDDKVCDLYGAWGPKKMMGREYDGVLRTTFLIDSKGRIARVFEDVKPAEHSAEVLAALASL